MPKLENYVTSTTSDIFALKNLPEVIKGALFSKYSRSQLGLRELLVKEFVEQKSAEFKEIAVDSQDQTAAIKRAQDFYDRILDGYGDDSIGELGGAHLACENITMLAAKHIQDARIGGSPLEKSTRYVYFEDKVDGRYRYLLDPTIMQSDLAELYTSTCDHLFSTYAALIPPLTEKMMLENPPAPDVSKGAHAAAIRAKVLDCLRGLLPAGTLTNMGVFGNGRFFETLIRRLRLEEMSEMQFIANQSYAALEQIIPSFIRRSSQEHRHQELFSTFIKDLKRDISQHVNPEASPDETSYVKLLDIDANAPEKIATFLLYEKSDLPLEKIAQHVHALSQERVDAILKSASKSRTNRRHKSPRALESVSATFEILADFGAYRDLQRHRMLTQERQKLTCHHGYYLPPELVNTPLQDIYVTAMERAKSAYEKIAKKFPLQAQYVVPMGYNIRWYFHMNIRALQWMAELRSQPQGHAVYRKIAQSMVAQVAEKEPRLAHFFAFVDFEGYAFGRLNQEIQNAKKREVLL